MRFRLVYRGPLKSANSADSSDKHKIRKEFHRQLKELWQHRPLDEHKKLLRPRSTAADELTGLIKVVKDFQFTPLVSDLFGWNTVAALDVLLLWTSPTGHVITKGGDIDNRIKVLFDSLRMPEANEIPPSITPGTDEKPFYVLLEDDKLVNSFSVSSDRLLREPNVKAEVEVIIQVNVGITRGSMANLGIPQ